MNAFKYCEDHKTIYIQKQGCGFCHQARDDVWRKKKELLENDYAIATKEAKDQRDKATVYRSMHEIAAEEITRLRTELEEAKRERDAFLLQENVDVKAIESLRTENERLREETIKAKAERNQWMRQCMALEEE